MPVDSIISGGMIGHRKGKIMQRVWIIELEDEFYKYFAGWEKENDPDLTGIRNRALEYTDEDEAFEDEGKLLELGFVSYVSRSERFVR